MDKTRIYGLNLLIIFIITTIISIIKKDNVLEYSSRLIFMAWLIIPILMIWYGGER